LYTARVPFKDFNKNPRTETIQLNLTETQFLKLLLQFQVLDSFTRKLVALEESGGPTMLQGVETVEFWTALEEVILEAYGVMSDDGMYFDKSGRYQYESSALHNAVMLMFIKDVAEARKMLDELTPDDLADLVKEQDANLVKAIADAENDDIKAELLSLRAQLAEAQKSGGPA
jgi:hypothetical protein